jgi:predicted kinase
MFLGSPGSGKTYFSRRLAEKIGAVILNGDALRMAMFGSLERIEDLRRRAPSRVYADVFNAMNYAARQSIVAGHSVIYDAQQTKRKNRSDMERIAEESGAISVLVWMKTNREVAMKRGQVRTAGDDSHHYDAETMKRLIDRFDKNADLPHPDENVIEISGEIPFEEQFRIFSKDVEVFQK